MRKRAFAHPNRKGTLMQSQASTRRKNIGKDKRGYWLTHEAHLLIQALAQEQGIEPGAFLEIISRQLAQERLPTEERVQIKEQAERITASRRHAAEQASRA